MALGEELRATLRGHVQDARKTLVKDVGDLLEGRFGVHRTGVFEEVTRLPEIQGNPRMRETRDLLERVLPPPPTSKAEKQVFADSYDGVLRAIAFTHLNRLVAFKMLEHPSRKILRETVGRERVSRGLARFLAADADAERLWNQGDRALAYERFLLAQCAQLHEQIGVLFDPDDLASRVFPRGAAIESVLDLLNDEALDAIWGDVETLGWVYQYYTPKELRDKARKDNSAPQNAFEMAFRNQFYTPRYVVQFLGDNTLGRLWVEMKPDSGLRQNCKYLLVQPDEKLKVRVKKDPRTILVLDPACGSGHFLLYAFDLFEIIYSEAWDDPDLGPTLQRDFADRDAFVGQIPRLIVEHNLHGIDIDRRSIQIAALALFLRAKSSNRDAVISRSHVVCAEPLRGSAALREDFKTRKLGGTATTVARIFDAVCDTLSIAGEGGTLLRIEKTIGHAVREEKARWEAAIGTPAQRSLFPGLGADGAQLDYSDVADEKFWDRAEADIHDLLRSYAQEADGAEAVRRRMFAEDGAEGLRFIDALRRRYDVLCMNPPFGAPTPRTKPLIDSGYPSSRQDLAACFVERAIELVPDGHIGAITAEALFFRRTLEAFRKSVLLARSSVEVMAHLGDNVLDAKVRVAAYAISVPHAGAHKSIFIRALEKRDREMRVRDAVSGWRSGSQKHVYTARQEEFEALPYSVFGYWCGTPVRKVFGQHPRLDPHAAAVRVGLQTSNDFRFVRLRWEVPQRDQKWLPFAKGGDYSPFHDDVHLNLNWAEGGIEIFAWGKGRPQNLKWFFVQGLTYPPRTNKPFAPRVLPRGCIFAHKGPAILVSEPAGGAQAALLAIVNSRPAQYLLSLGTGMAEAKDISNSYEVGLVQRLPVPPAAMNDAVVSAAGLQAVSARRSLDLHDEPKAVFTLPFALPRGLSLEGCAVVTHAENSAAAQQYDAAQQQIDILAARHYGFGATEMKELAEHVGPLHTLTFPKLEDERKSMAERIVSWCMGVAMGRFDVRLATGVRAIPTLSDPWDPVPAFSPGMLPDGIVPAGYPEVIAPDGILIDDVGHDNDVVGRVQRVLQLLWGEAAQAIENEACRLLGTRGLREYFSHASANTFWKKHLARYSQSKRRAPIYWLLQSSAGFFSAWIYAHRLKRDTLYKLLGSEYLGGRIARVRHQIDQLRPGGKVRPELDRAQQRTLEVLDDEFVDLQRFHQAIEAVTRLTNDRGEPAPYEAALADGVVLAASPLHAVMPWPYKKEFEGVSRSELEVYWLKLQSGDYPWSRNAMHYWPDRTTAASKKDGSVAVAHALDEQFFPGLRNELAARAAAAAARDAADEDADAEDDGNDDEESAA